MNIHKFNVKPKTIPPKGKISGPKSKFDYLGNF